ncbi:archaetidylinositol phosphate synthase [Archaeoglobus sp.]
MLSVIKGRTTELLKPLTSVLAKTGVKPNHLTLTGLLLGLLCAYEIYLGNFILSAIFLILSSLMDALDGALARNLCMTTEFGGFLDSVLDRYVDIAIFFALGFHIDWFLAFFALSGALMVSYTRARAEKIIPKCDVGIAERGERLILILIGLMFPSVLSSIVLLVGILSHLTALHRIIYTYRKCKRKT